MNQNNTLILIFSSRDRIREILTLGLLQCRLQVMQADTSSVAVLKANQFVPALIIIDISSKNLHDLLIVNRLYHCERTRKIKVIAVVPACLKAPLEKKIAESQIPDSSDNLHMLEYPFNFSTILQHIKNMLQLKSLQNGDRRQETVDRIRQNYNLAQKLLDNSVPTDQKLADIAEGIQKQWAFPFTVIKALDIIGSRDSCCSELARCISADPSASTSILKVANTVFYAGRQNRISDLREAVVRLGFQQTRNLLACLALIDLTKNVYCNTGFTRTEFWLHSLSVGLIAEQLCDQCRFRRPELAFVAGLIHDIGKIPMDNLFEDLFATLLEETVSQIVPFYQTENRVLGFNHAELGHYLTRKWNFPHSISGTILNHHRPQMIDNSFPVTDRILQSAVFVANMISKSLHMGQSCDNVLYKIPASMLRELKIPRGPSDKFMNTVIRRINTLAKYLNISIRPLTNIPSEIHDKSGHILFVHGSHPPYHPLTAALMTQGYKVRISSTMLSEADPDIRVIISLPEPGSPLDIVLYEDDIREERNQRILKIFIIDINSPQIDSNTSTGKDMVFIHQDHLDVRHLLNILDRFHGYVVKPPGAHIQNQDSDNS